MTSCGVPLGYLVLLAFIGLVHFLIARRWSHRLFFLGLIFASAFVGLAGETRNRFETDEKFGLKSAERINHDFPDWLSARDKGRLYFVMLHVPLFIVYPSRVPAGLRADAFASLRELPATVVDLAGVADSAGFPGTSLARFWRNPGGTSQVAEDMLLAETEQAYDVYPDWYPARKGRMQSVIFRNMHYIKNHGDGREELYNLASDLDETRDLSAMEPRLLEEYRAHVQDMLATRRKQAHRTGPR